MSSRAGPGAPGPSMSAASAGSGEVQTHSLLRSKLWPHFLPPPAVSQGYCSPAALFSPRSPALWIYCAHRAGTLAPGFPKESSHLLPQPKRGQHHPEGTVLAHTPRGNEAGGLSTDSKEQNAAGTTSRPWVPLGTKSAPSEQHPGAQCVAASPLRLLPRCAAGKGSSAFKAQPRP